MNESGKVLIDDKPAKVNAIRGIVERKLSGNPNLIFSVQTHPRTKYQNYLQILDQLKEAKATKISIANPPAF
jgi:biopolymer transport protein ExbD